MDIIIMKYIPFLAIASVLLSSCAGEKAKPYYDFYIGSYTKHESHVEGKGEGIYQIRINMVDTSMQRLATIVGLVNPSFVKLSPDKKTLYAVNEITPEDSLGKGRVSVFKVNGIQADRISDTETKGYAPCHIGIDPSGKICVVTNYIGEKAMVYKILPDGNLDRVTQLLQMGGMSVNPDRQTAGHLHCSVFTSDSKYCYIADLGADRIHMYSSALEVANLIPLKKRAFYPVTVKGAGPRHLAVSLDNKYLFCLNELKNSITTYKINGSFGDLETLSSVSSLPSGYSGANDAADIHLSKDGKLLYVSNRGSDDIGAFIVNGDGTLKLIGHYKTMGKTPRNFAITSDGMFMLIANQDSDNLSMFEIMKDGSLVFIKAFPIATPACVEEI